MSKQSYYGKPKEIWETCVIDRDGDIFCETKPEKTKKLHHFDFQAYENEGQRRAISTNKTRLADYRNKLKKLQPTKLEKIKTETLN